MTWHLTTLSEYFEITSSKRVFKRDWKDRGVPFYRAREIVKLAKNNHVDSELFISDEMYAEYSEKYGSPKTGDILVTGVGTLGIVYIVKEGDKFYFKDGNIIWLKKKKPINSLFVEYAFKTAAIQRYIQNSPGATVGTYTISKANQTPISLPPLAEQQKIAAILDAADQLRQKDQQLIDHYTTLSQSLFLEMFGDPVTNPMEWERKCFLDVFKTQTGKLDSNAATINGEYPFFTCAKEALSIDSYSYDFEALLLAGNNAAGVFDVKYYNGKFDAYQRTYILNINTPNILYSFMKTSLEYRLKDLQRLSIGSSTQYLTMKILGRLNFTIPPLDLQNQFAQHIEKIEQQKQQAQASLEKSEALFNSLLQRAFKGELTQNSPV